MLQGLKQGVAQVPSALTDPLKCRYDCSSVSICTLQCPPVVLKNEFEYLTNHAVNIGITGPDGSFTMSITVAKCLVLKSMEPNDK